MGLTSIQQQWVFMVHDTSTSDTEVASILTKYV